MSDGERETVERILEEVRKLITVVSDCTRRIEKKLDEVVRNQNREERYEFK